MYVSENYHLIRIEASYGDRDLTFMQEYIVSWRVELVIAKKVPLLHSVLTLCICYVFVIRSEKWNKLHL